MPLKITSRWLELDPSAPDALTAEKIYYSSGETIADKISENNTQTTLSSPNIDSSVQDGDFVYIGSDGKYYPALADGTDKQNVVGMYDADSNTIITTGVVEVSVTANYGDWVYLSDTNAGKLQTAETTVKIGLALGNNKVLLASISSGSGGSGIGDVTKEDLIYYFLLEDNPFSKKYYDIFRNDDNITLVQGTATFDGAHTKFVISDTSTQNCIFETPNVLEDSDTYYRFLVHLETTANYTVEYSTDNGSTWNSCNADETVLVSTGFTSLKFKFTFTSDGDFDSYGVLYKYDYNRYTSSESRMFETLTVDQDYTAPKEITLPNDATYTTDNKSLEVYLNRVRLIPTVDYEEVDNRTVRFLIDLRENDIIVFTEKFSYIDVSDSNRARLDYEHNDQGQHIFTDLTTGVKYRLAVDNGDLILIEQ